MSVFKKLAIIFSIAAALVMAAFMAFFVSSMASLVLSVEVNELCEDNGRVLQLDDQYYMLQNNKIINPDSNETVYISDSSVRIFKEYNNLFWIFTGDENDNLKSLDKEGNVINQYTIPPFTTDFMVCGDEIYTVSTIGVDAINCSETSDTDLTEPDSEPDDNSSEVYTNDEYKKTYSDESVSISEIRCEDTDILKISYSQGKVGYFVMSLSEHEWIMSGSGWSMINFDNDSAEFYKTDTRSDTVYSYSFTAKTFTDLKPDMEGCLFPYEPISKNDRYVIAVTQQTRGRFMDLSEPSDWSNDMTYHFCDNVLKYNSDDFSLEASHRFDKNERVLYADVEKAVTYINHQYKIYSISDNFAVTDVLPADEIIDGNSYQFESCGDRIFVFDDTGNLLNKVSIK